MAKMMLTVIFFSCLAFEIPQKVSQYNMSVAMPALNSSLTFFSRIALPPHDIAEIETSQG